MVRHTSHDKTNEILPQMSCQLLPFNNNNGRGDYKDRVVSLHVNTGGATYLHAWWTVTRYQFCIYCISIWIYIVIKLMMILMLPKIKTCFHISD
jgi:hypothetical protein